MKVIYNIIKRNILNLSVDNEVDFGILEAFMRRCATSAACPRENVPFLIVGVIKEERKLIIQSEYITSEPAGTLIKGEGSVLSFLRMNGVELEMLQPSNSSSLHHLEEGLLGNKINLSNKFGNFINNIKQKLRI